MPKMVTQVRLIPRTFCAQALILLGFFIVPALPCLAQKHARTAPSISTDQKTIGEEISGMYTFLREGEFVQITVEQGKLSGFVSRYGDRESDKDAFLDQFFSKGSLEGNKLSFTTKAVHGTWFEFSGSVSRGEGKTPQAEGYWVIRGTLKQYDEDDAKNVSAKSREIAFKSFPQDLEEGQQPKQ